MSTGLKGGRLVVGMEWEQRRGSGVMCRVEKDRVVGGPQTPPPLPPPSSAGGMVGPPPLFSPSYRTLVVCRMGSEDRTDVASLGVRSYQAFNRGSGPFSRVGSGSYSGYQPDSEHLNKST